MKKNYWVTLFLVFSLIFQPFSIWATENELLRRDDIQKLMQQIFAQHIDKKTITSEILKNSFKTYIEQFDPEGIYFLQSEVDPYLQMNQEELTTIERQYRKGDYSAYEKLNDLVQKAISRSRSIRSQLEQDPKGLLKQAMEYSPKEENLTFPANSAELKEKLRNHLLTYLQMEIRRYGEKSLKGYEPQAIALYEKSLRAVENQYTYRHENGELLSQADQESRFTLHVLKALAKSLDAHTAFFDPKEAYDMRVRLEKGFEGVGVAFQEIPQGIVVTHLLENGPAAKEGQIKIGDFLVEINHQAVKGMEFEQVMEQLRESKEDTVYLVLKRKNKDQTEKQYQVTLKRDKIVLNQDRVDIGYEQVGNGIVGVITLHSFYQNDQGITSEKDVKEAIKKLNQEGKLQGLILDLRENSGGFLSQAVKVAGLFITNGVVVVSKYSSGDEKIYRDMDSKVAYDGPLVVLTSRATASAAEIVAQALQDYGVALIVGDEQTYGKGTIQSQTVTDNKGSSYFKVTVGKYYTVSGKTPQINGVKADIIVPGPYAQFHMGEEYLEHTIKKEDKIAPEYADQLQDIDPALRPWYLKYYMPTLQSKITLWREYLPQLQKNSNFRLSNNKNYQLYLKKINQAAPTEKEEEETINGNFGNADFQLAEALHIVRDMMYLQSKARQKEYTVGTHPLHSEELEAVKR